MAISYLIKEVVRAPHCTFYLFSICNDPSYYIYFILLIFLLIPFYLVASIILRRSGFSKHKTYEQGSCFCISYAFSWAINIYCLVTNAFTGHSVDLDTFIKVRRLSNSLYFMSLLSYFVQVCHVLTLLQTFGFKLIYYFSKLVQYAFTLLVIIETVCVFIPISKLIFNILYTFLEKNFFYLEYAFSCASFLILLICFMFSNISTIFPAKLRYWVNICLLLIPLVLFIRVYIYFYFNSLIIQRMTQTNLVHYVRLALSMSFSDRFLIDYLILYIIFILSDPIYQSDGDQSVTAENPVDLSLNNII